MTHSSEGSTKPPSSTSRSIASVLLSHTSLPYIHPRTSDVDNMPLTASSSILLHAAQNAALIWLSFILLPFSSFILSSSLAIRFLFSPNELRTRQQNRALPSHIFKPRTVLVTGVGMTKGLALARNFYLAGHNVIGADFEPSFLPISSGRVSKSLKTFYKLHRPAGGRVGSQAYANRLLDIIRREDVDIWVSCSGVASAVEDGYAKELIEQLTPCKAIQFDVETVERLHEKHNFIEHVRDLGLSIPDTYTVRSKKALLRVLQDHAFSRKKFLLKYIGTDDSVRGDMTLLPLATPAQTEAHVAGLDISDDRPWILQQFIAGPEYCTHALVVAGDVKAFVACSSSELLMHYTALPAKSNLTQSMLRFTREVAAAGGPSFSGHCSFDFLVEEHEAAAGMRQDGRTIKLYPIECNPRAHTAVALFRNTPEMAEAYMTLLDEKTEPAVTDWPSSRESRRQTNGLAKQPLFPTAPPRIHWLGHDLISRLILPVLSLALFQSNLTTVRNKLLELLEHLFAWSDGTFELWDPWPAFWLYHVYWPVQFALSLLQLVWSFGRRGKWSRVNVSTCKMFMC